MRFAALLIFMRVTPGKSGIKYGNMLEPRMRFAALIFMRHSIIPHLCTSIQGHVCAGGDDELVEEEPHVEMLLHNRRQGY